MLVLQHQAELPITATDIAKFTLDKSDELCKDISVIYWSRQQHAIKEEDPKRLIFVSDFGTGKTILLKNKALELSGKDPQIASKNNKKKACFRNVSNEIEIEGFTPKVYFVSFVLKNSLLFNSLKKELNSDDTGIKTMSLIKLLALENECKKTLQYILFCHKCNT